MIALVVGKSNTGKSELAEKLALETGDEKVYYLATMNVMDDAGRKRVIKHRKQREGKGFITIEKQRDIARVLDDKKNAHSSTVLLECVANLVANYIFDDHCKEIDLESVAAKASAEIKELSEKVHNLIIVTDEYDKDGDGYDDSTRNYVKTLSRTNELIRDYCDKVYDLLSKNEGN